MIDFIHLNIIAALQIVAAAGIIHFWTNWFKTDHNEPWLPTGYIAHERCFVFADSVMSVLLVISAVLLILGKSMGERLSLVCGGMMLFLAILDTAYFIQNRMLGKNTGRNENLGILVPLFIVSFVLIFRFI